MVVTAVALIMITSQISLLAPKPKEKDLFFSVMFKYVMLMRTLEMLVQTQSSRIHTAVQCTVVVPSELHQMIGSAN